MNVDGIYIYGVQCASLLEGILKLKLKTLTIVSIFIMLLLVSTATIANKNIKIIIPFSAGGGTATMSKFVVDYLESNGYNIDLHIAGNPANARRIYENTKAPSIVVWENGFLTESGSIADIGMPTKENFFNIWFWAPFYVCSKPGYEDILSISANVGVNPHPSFPNWLLEKLVSENPNLSPVVYKNSGAIKTALVSGEINIGINDRGLEWQNDGIADCKYNTSMEITNGTKPLGKEIGKNINYSFIAYSFVVNMDQDLRISLQKDFKSALKSEKISRYFEGRNQDQRIMQLSQLEQLEFLSSTLD